MGGLIGKFSFDHQEPLARPVLEQMLDAARLHRPERLNGVQRLVIQVLSIHVRAKRVSTGSRLCDPCASAYLCVLDVSAFSAPSALRGIA